MSIIADTIANGREYLERHGWWRGNVTFNRDRQVCALGALLYGNGYDKHQRHKPPADVEKAMESLDKYLRSQPGLHGSSLVTWNDDKLHGAPNKQAVLDLFAKVEKIERAGFDPDA